MAEGKGRGVIHPVLHFLREATPKSASPGGKNEKSIVKLRLEKQRKTLSKAFESFNRETVSSRAGRSQLVVKMFEDSSASSWAPVDIFSEKDGCQVVSPALDGYMVEAEEKSFSKLANKIKRTTNIKDKVDISRVENVTPFTIQDALRGSEIDEVWPDSNIENAQFNIWLLPFRSSEARASIATDFMNFFEEGVISFGNQKYHNPFDTSDSDVLQLNKILDEYREQGYASFSVEIKSKDGFEKIISSGAVYRIEPASPIKANEVPPGVGEEPVPELIETDGLPAVVVVDGGHSAKSYDGLKALDVPPLVPDYEADLKHGNQVASIVCHGYAWNNNLKLPELNCRFVPAQAITKNGVPSQPTTHQFLSYLRDLARASKKYSSVWNLSFNATMPNFSNDEVSYLGHNISKLAREFDILPVVSIGNVSDKNKVRLCPPADCEAALTVSGRQACEGVPHTPCDLSLKGPGPSGMQKPDLSWFSHLRMIGGVCATGTSYSAPLVASLASHTFEKLKDPSPDLVKALLINRAEIESHDHSLGWGTPWEEGDYPWLCASDTVTLAWRSLLKPGFDYYWHDIPVPQEMFDDNKVSGEAVLTAILKPKTSESLGRHYFSTRLQTSLKATRISGSTVDLIKRPSQAALSQKEKDDLKWNPVRHQRSKLSGKIIPDSVRLYARVFSRDLYQFDIKTHHELGEQEVAFVLTFKKPGAGDALYHSAIRDLGNDVEYAIDVEQNIDLST